MERLTMLRPRPHPWRTALVGAIGAALAAAAIRAIAKRGARR